MHYLNLCVSKLPGLVQQSAPFSWEKLGLVQQSMPLTIKMPGQVLQSTPPTMPSADPPAVYSLVSKTTLGFGGFP